MSSSLTKRTWILITIFVISALLFAFLYKAKQGSVNDMKEDTEVMNQELVPSSGIAPVLRPKESVSSTQEYSQLVVDYEGRRIQFDIGCQANPNNVSYKNGTQVMFDNRSGDGRWISVGDAEYYIVGHGYKILTLSSKTIPTKLFINCGSAVNVGQIHLQP